MGSPSRAIGVDRGIAQGNLPVATTGDQVQIKREASRVVDSNKYRVPLSVEAIQTVTLVAPFDGKIKQVVLKTNSKGTGTVRGHSSRQCGSEAASDSCADGDESGPGGVEAGR